MNNVQAPRPRLRRGNFLQEAIETLLLIVVVYTLVNLATVRFFIEGPSMQPSFYAGQYLIVSRAHYLLSEPQRGDIVVFDRPDDDQLPNDPLLIKRLIGLPGETVSIRDGQTFIDDVPLDEPYILEPCRTSTCTNSSWTLKENEYFFMGDNRNNSSDSRAFGAVTKDRIIGEAVIRYWTPADIGIVIRHRFLGD